MISKNVNGNGHPGRVWQLTALTEWLSHGSWAVVLGSKHAHVETYARAFLDTSLTADKYQQDPREPLVDTGLSNSKYIYTRKLKAAPETCTLYIRTLLV